MRPPFDPFPPNLFEASRLAGEASKSFSAIHEQMRGFESSVTRHLREKLQSDEAIRRALIPHYDLVDRFRGLTEIIRVQEEQDRRWGEAFSSAALEQAHMAATLTHSLSLPSGLEQFRTPVAALTDKLLSLKSFDRLQQPAYMDAFNRTSALSDIIENSMGVGRELRDATQAFTLGAIPAFDTLGHYRSFLDAAGLQLSRWPRMRLLSVAEKRRRLKARLKEKAEPAHVKRAKSLVHRYELTLREILDSVMADAYGEEWADERLPLCDCKDLLGKWRKRGGDVLDHADYVHYSRIMSHPQHFEAVFEAGFDDPVALAALLINAGRLRAASHHARVFTLEDLRDLRVIWNTIEAGLLALTDDYEVEAWA